MPIPNPFSKQSGRAAVAPARNAASGVATNGASQAITAWIIAAQPELVVFAPAIQAALHGVFSYVGSKARDQAEKRGGVWGLLAKVFGLLG